MGAKVTISPAEFHRVTFENEEISVLITKLAERLNVTNPIHLVVDERTPMAKTSAELDTESADTTVIIRAESGALEDSKRLTTFGPLQATESIGRMLLRSRDRLRADFADVPPDLELTLQQNAAWDAYSAGRLARQGCTINQQRWRYNYRNRFGFTDAVDAAFDQLWAAEDLSWADVTASADVDAAR